jgi:hypothetical protein
VRQVAARHGLPYHCHDTFFGAVRSHLRTLKRFGAGEAVQGAPGMPLPA